MYTVCKKDMCAGCMACVDICPKNAIVIEDTLKEYNAVIDKDKCIGCDACHKVCQANHPPVAAKPIYWKEGWAVDRSVREASSSGGFAAAIERAFVKDGGMVCSCVQIDGEFRFAFANTEEEVAAFIGSKYVKSNPSGIYKTIRKLVKDGRKILFVGLPCQAAAVKNFVGDNENLYLIDLICHGSPSPKVLDSFLRSYKPDLRHIGELSFRTKTDFHVEENGRRLTVPTVRDLYSRCFLEGISYTENCYSCRYAALDRVTDITLGDSWGSELPAQTQREGVSIALCQTPKGRELLKASGLELLDVDLQRAVEHNHQLAHPSKKHPKRDRFFTELKKGTGFRQTMLKCFPKRCAKLWVYTLLYKIGIKTK